MSVHAGHYSVHVWRTQGTRLGIERQPGMALLSCRWFMVRLMRHPFTRWGRQ